MKVIKYFLNSPRLLYDKFRQVMPVSLDGNILRLNPNFGSGLFHLINLQKGLWLQQYDLMLYEDLKLIREPTAINNYFGIYFYLSDSAIVTEGEDKNYRLCYDSVSLFLTSSATPSIFKLPANEQLTNKAIFFSKQWVEENVYNDRPYLKTIFDTDAPIYIYENLGYGAKVMVKKLDANQSKLNVLSQVLSLMDYIFECVRLRDDLYEIHSQIHPDDINELLSIKQYLDTNIEENISIEQLAQMANMSISKFKRLFKRIFHTTPYQYHLANKMEKAKESLEKGEYTVSEMGFILGYSNISQFSKAFKNHFGSLPSEVKA